MKFNEFCFLPSSNKENHKYNLQFCSYFLLQYRPKNPIFISKNLISHRKKPNCTFDEIQFLIGRNPIPQMKKSNFTLEEIQCQVGRNLILHWKKSNFTLEKIQFHVGRNPISPIMKIFTHNSSPMQ